MTALIQNALLQSRWQPCIQFIRFRKRINIQRPAKPHYERAKVLKVCTPIFVNPKKYLSLPELCQKQNELSKEKEEVDNPFERLLARDLLNWFNHSKMILFFHANPITAEELFKARIMFRKQDMSLRSYGKAIVQTALDGTNYETVLSLFTCPISMAFSPEPHVLKVLKINKKVPQLILLAGIVDGRLLSRNELIQYSRLPDIQIARAQLVSTLNSAASQVVQHLTHHQQTLVGHLKHHVELQTKRDTEET